MKPAPIKTMPTRLATPAREGAITLALCALFLGYDIGLHPVVLWDESRVISNALEMSRTGLSLVTTYNFQPDLWNTKPPLLIWLIAGCIRLFGPSEWAFRLPSLLAAVATVTMVMAFSWRLTRNRFIALCAPTLLTFSPGFYGAHAAQSADYEMLLCLFTTAYLLLLFELIHRRRPAAKSVLTLGLLVAGACMTKGIAGVMPGVGVAIYVLFRGRWPRLFKTRWYALSGLIVLILVGGFYVAREWISPGYFDGVMRFELGGRFLNGLKSHVQPPLYYIQVVLGLFVMGPILVSLLFAPAFRWPRTRAAAFLTYGGFVSVAILLVFSVSRTKIFWYMVPIYPLLSIMMAIMIDRILQIAGPSPTARASSRRLVIGLAVLLMAGLAVWNKAVELPRTENNPQGRYGQVFAQLDKSGFHTVRAIDGGVANDDNLVDYTPQLRIYTLVWRARGMAIKLGERGGMALVGHGEVVVTCDPWYLDAVRNLGAPLTTVEGCAAATRRRVLARP